MSFDELRLEPHLSEIPRLIDWVEARCAAAAVAGEVAMKLALAVEEAVANVINHSLPGSPPPHRVLVRLEIGADEVAAEVIDNGGPFDPTGAPPPDLSLPLEERQPGGPRHPLDEGADGRSRLSPRGGQQYFAAAQGPALTDARLPSCTADSGPAVVQH